MHVIIIKKIIKKYVCMYKKMSVARLTVFSIIRQSSGPEADG